jgi:hypothetical protein
MVSFDMSSPVISQSIHIKGWRERDSGILMDILRKSNKTQQTAYSTVFRGFLGIVSKHLS